MSKCFAVSTRTPKFNLQYIGYVVSRAKTLTSPRPELINGPVTGEAYLG